MVAGRGDEVTAPVELVAGPDQDVLGHLHPAQRAVGELVAVVAGRADPGTMTIKS